LYLMTTDSIVIVAVVVLLGLWWLLVTRRQQAKRDDSETRTNRSKESAPQTTENEGYVVPGTWHPAGVEYVSAGDDDRVEPMRLAPGVCPACQTENDPFYTYCRSCIHRLGQV
jgi:hypothetical protein